MNNKKTKPKKSKKAFPRITKPRVAVVVVAVILIAAVVSVFLNVFRNPTLFQAQQGDVEQRLRGSLDDLVFSGNESYSTLEDNGCIRKQRILGADIGCTFTGFKLSTAAGDRSAALKNADQQLRNQGYKRYLPQTKTDNDFESALDGSNATSLYYRNGGAVGRKDEFAVELMYFDPQAQPTTNSSTLSTLIKNGKVKIPVNGQFVYGISISASYFTCSSELLKMPCPAPPHEPKAL